MPKGPAGTDAPSDVIVLVVPKSAEEARIAIVYQKPITVERVRHDVNLLAKTTGGSLSKDLDIQTKSLQPNDLTRFPVRTSADFTLLHSPQVHDSSPTLTPYLTTFQSWNHVEVIFSLPELNPYTGVVKFESPELTVQLIKDTGVYRYEADIREHEKPLPPLTVEQKTPGVVSNAVSGSVTGTPVVSEKPSASSGSLPLALFLSGCALTGGACLYLALTRRSSDGVSSRSVRR